MIVTIDAKEGVIAVVIDVVPAKRDHKGNREHRDHREHQGRQGPEGVPVRRESGDPEDALVHKGIQESKESQVHQDRLARKVQKEILDVPVREET